MPKASGQIGLKATAVGTIRRRDGTVETVTAREVEVVVEPSTDPQPDQPAVLDDGPGATGE